MEAQETWKAGKEIDTKNTFSPGKTEKDMITKIQNSTPTSSQDTEVEILCIPNPDRLFSIQIVSEIYENEYIT